MPAASLQGHISTGHACWPPTSTESGFSAKTQIEGKVCQLLGLTKYVNHACGITVHSGSSRIVSSGSSKVFIEGRAAIRIGDSIACGDTVAQGASHVFIGG